MKDILAIAALISVLTFGAANGVALYTIEWLGDLPGGPDSSRAIGINEAEQVGGSGPAAAVL